MEVLGDGCQHRNEEVELLRTEMKDITEISWNREVSGERERKRQSPERSERQANRMSERS